jgi:hypothetical protein
MFSVDSSSLEELLEQTVEYNDFDSTKANSQGT